MPAPRQNQISAFSTRVSHMFDTSLDKMLATFWKAKVKVEKSSEVTCEENFLRTTTRDDSGRYTL